MSYFCLWQIFNRFSNRFGVFFYRILISTRGILQLLYVLVSWRFLWRGFFLNFFINFWYFFDYTFHVLCSYCTCALGTFLIFFSYRFSFPGEGVGRRLVAISRTKPLATIPCADHVILISGSHDPPIPFERPFVALPYWLSLCYDYVRWWLYICLMNEALYFYPLHLNKQVRLIPCGFRVSFSPFCALWGVKSFLWRRNSLDLALRAYARIILRNGPAGEFCHSEFILFCAFSDFSESG